MQHHFQLLHLTYQKRQHNLIEQKLSRHPELVSGSKNNHRKAAFTLAEVLITLGIIGVVAALTLPALIQKYEEKKVVNQLTKVYSTLSQAWLMMQSEYGPINEWSMVKTDTGLKDAETGKAIYDHSAQSLISERLRKYLKVSRVCKVGEICYPYAREYLNGNKGGVPKPLTGAGTEQYSPDANFYLDDGTYISLGWYSSSSNYIDFDITLPGNKRSLGQTEFYFQGHPQRIIPEDRFEYCDPNLTTTSSGRGCTAWVLHFKNMDYLHCREKLSWDGKHTCKE